MFARILGLNQLFLTALVAVVLGVYGCGGGAPDASKSPATTENEEHDHDHEHADGKDHDHDHEHADGEDHDHDHEHGEEGHGHHHAAPHGGTLVAIGDHFAHLEILLDSETGKMTVYVLDGGAENPVRLTQEDIEFSVALKKEGAGTTVTVLQARAVENPLTGEKVGDSSEFFVESEKLVGVNAFSAVVSTLDIKGEKVEDLEFDFPEGNE